MIRGQTRVLETLEIEAKLNASIHNRFDIEVIDAKTGEIKQRAQAENMILDRYWNYFGNETFDNLAFGSGTGTLDASRTDLFNRIGYKGIGDITTSRDDENCVYTVQGKIVLTESQYVGSTFTEVGLYYSSGVITHAMLKDMNGNQISIIKTDTDIINIYATVFLHWTPSITFTLGKSLLDRLIGISSIASASPSFAVKVVGSGSLLAVGSPTFTVSNKKLTINTTRIPASSSANGHGIYEIGLYFSTTPMIKTSAPMTWRSNDFITGEAVGTGDGTTTMFSTCFPYAQNATVYLDGVEATGVTVTSSDTYVDDIVFDAAPAAGAIITINYETSVIAKDKYHVFDFSIEIQLNEKTV